MRAYQPPNTPAPWAKIVRGAGPVRIEDLLAVSWIMVAPALAGISGHLLYADIPGTGFVRDGAHGTAAMLHSHGAMPGKDAATMKVLWVRRTRVPALCLARLRSPGVI